MGRGTRHLTTTLLRHNALAGIILLLIGFAAGYKTMEAEKNTPPAPVPVQSGDRIQPCLTPDSRCLPLILKEISNARTSIHVMAYTLTSKPVTQALIHARRKGIHVEVIADRTAGKSPNPGTLNMLRQEGIPVWIDGSVAIAHNKVILIDNKITLTGSYNFSNAAENRNAENLLLIRSPEVTGIYLQYWMKRREQAAMFMKKQQGSDIK